MRRLFPLWKHSTKSTQKSKWSTWLRPELPLAIFCLVSLVALTYLGVKVNAPSFLIGNLAMAYLWLLKTILSSYFTQQRR